MRAIWTWCVALALVGPGCVQEEQPAAKEGPAARQGAPVAKADDGRKADAKGGARVFDFEEAEAGKLPPGFTAARTGQGKDGVWVVREEQGAPSGKQVLVQTDPDPTNSRFPLVVRDDLTAGDVTVSVAFKAVSGNTDKAAGLIVRYQDAGNYYIARANAEENNVRIYKFEDGKRSKQFASADVEVPAGQWQTLALKARGNRFEVSLDGKKLFEATDDTFKEAGKVGLWTKADSVTCFDDLKVEVE